MLSAYVPVAGSLLEPNGDHVGTALRQIQRARIRAAEAGVVDAVAVAVGDDHRDPALMPFEL
jgi:hypothetical protein